MSDTPVSEMDFNNKMAWAWTTLKFLTGPRPVQILKIFAGLGPWITPILLLK